jgi:antitoxin HicB
MTQHAQQSLDEYLAREYPFQVIASRDGGYVVLYPDLPGCMTQADTIDEIPELAEEARRLWIETEYEDGRDIPLPSYPEEYSGKFVVRLPRTLHRQLSEQAERQGISLNQHVVMLLSVGGTQARLERQLVEAEERLVARLDAISEQVDRFRFQMTSVSFGTQRPGRSPIGKAGLDQRAYQVKANLKAVAS